MNTFSRVISLTRSLLSNTYFKVVMFFHGTFRWFAVEPAHQQNAFSSHGLDRAAGIERLDSVLLDIVQQNYSENDGMFSEHLVLLSSLSVKQDFARILEIGTYDARTALILSRLFPQADITTIDLPSNDEAFSGSYQRGDSVSAFTRVRNANLEMADNVNFQERNSLSLALDDSKFDLIWIDGAHGYPVASMDIINSFRLCSRNGWILVDDVWKSANSSDSMYKSVASYESMTALVDAGLIDDFSLLPKRLGSFHNTPGRKKFIGIFRR